MATIETTRTVRCDNCGAVETVRTGEQSSMSPTLPSLDSHAFTPLSFIERTQDYCKACVDAVKVAIERALLDRQAAHRKEVSTT